MARANPLEASIYGVGYEPHGPMRVLAPGREHPELVHSILKRANALGPGSVRAQKDELLGLAGEGKCDRDEVLVAAEGPDHDLSPGFGTDRGTVRRPPG